MSGPRRRQQSGSVIVLVAAMSLILVAFVGLSVDGGEIETQQRESQNAADGGALAAATAVINASSRGYTITDAKNIGNTVVSYNGIPTADASFSFLDSLGLATTTPSSVATVTTTITHQFSTLFLPIMGIDTATVSATATVTVTQPSSNTCAICVMNSTANNTFNVSAGTVSVEDGSIKVASAGSPAMNVTNSGSVTVTGSGANITSVGSVSVNNTSPAPLTGAAYTFTDPLATVTAPTVGGTANSVSYSGNTTINPGTYGSITVPGGATVTMNPGTYIVAGGMSINGTLKGSNVMIYLTCLSGGSTAAACTAPGQNGGNVTIGGGGVLSVSAPSTGTYAGLAIFGDRNNNASFTVNGLIQIGRAHV